MFTAFRLTMALGLLAVSLTASPVWAVGAGLCAGVNVATVLIDTFGSDDE